MHGQLIRCYWPAPWSPCRHADGQDQCQRQQGLTRVPVPQGGLRRHLAYLMVRMHTMMACPLGAGVLAGTLTAGLGTSPMIACLLCCAMLGCPVPCLAPALCPLATPYTRASKWQKRLGQGARMQRVPHAHLLQPFLRSLNKALPRHPPSCRNFAKFIVRRDGTVQGRYGPRTSPCALEPQIQECLAQGAGAK
jgi:hypothetical protein